MKLVEIEEASAAKKTRGKIMKQQIPPSSTRDEGSQHV
jgi:hypothetical protein